MLRTTNVSVHAQHNSNRNRIIDNLCTHLLTRTLACHGGQARYDKPAHFQTTPSRRHLERKSRESTFLMRFKTRVAQKPARMHSARRAQFLPLLLSLWAATHGLPSASSTQPQALSLTRSIRTTIFNAYPNVTMNVFVVFEVETVNRIKYGQERTLNITYQQHADFILQFKKEITDGIELSALTMIKGHISS